MEHSNYDAAKPLDGDPLRSMLKLQGRSVEAAHAETIGQDRERPRLFAAYGEGSRWSGFIYMDEKYAGRFRSSRLSLLRRVLGLRPS